MSRTTASDRLRRVLAIVPYIVANPGQKVAALADRFGVSEKSLLEDLSVVFMVGLPPYSPDSLIDVEIDDESRVTIGLADYFSRPLRLTPAQGLGLVAASDALLSVPGTDPDGSLAQALRKLGNVLGMSDGDSVDVFLGSAETSVLEQLRSAVTSGLEIDLEYYSYGRDATSRRRVAPWRVFADSGFWYLHAWCHLADGERLFRVDRIEAVADTGTPSTVLPDPSAAEKGVFNASDTDPNVVLRLASSDRWIIEAFPCEVVADEGDTFDISLVISAVPWLQRLLVRLGSKVEVVAEDGLPQASDLAYEAASRILQRYHQ